MKKFIQAIDYNIWEAIELEPFIPTIVNESTIETNVSALEKPRDQWSEEDRRKIQPLFLKISEATCLTKI